MSPDPLVEVAVGLPLSPTYHYRIPSALRTPGLIGCRVLVPFGPRRVVGWVVGLPDATELDESRVKDVIDVLDAEPSITAEVLKLAKQAAAYFAQPLGELLRAALPAGAHAVTERVAALAGAPGAPGALQGRTGERRRDLLRALQRGPLPCGRLLRAVGGGASLRDLVALEQAAWLTLEFRVASPRVAPKLAKRVELLRNPSGAGGLGARQRELIGILEAEGPQDLAELSRRVPGARSSLRGLEKRGLVQLTEVERRRDPFRRSVVEADAPPELTAGQRAAVSAIEAALEAGRFRTFLLQGETGSGKPEGLWVSGKTVVYLAGVDRAGARDRSALVLVPEIALTPQLSARFRARFGDEQVAVLHSGLTDGERFDEWRRIRRGEVRIVVGARSAVFAPLQRPAVLVVDEEHDSSYRQEETPRYDARSLALLRGQSSGAAVVLGSATPSLESRLHAARDKYALLVLRGRPTGGELPTVRLLDLRAEAVDLARTPLSEPLQQQLLATHAAGEQAILFLNRRGFAPSVLCPRCGQTLACRSCSVSLTYHRGQARLRCHYCDHSEKVPDGCPVCGAAHFVLLGMGTEKVEEAVRQLLPSARVARLDRDATVRRSTPEVLQAMRRREIDVLVGTQMVTKGHDFPWVTLVGVLLADQGLRLPDFRAAERTFQLLTQVAGRAGRGQRPGQVLVQTFSPEHYAVTTAAAQDYDAFCQREMQQRRDRGYPPFGHLIALRLDGPDREGARAAAVAAGEALKARLLTPGAPRITLLGPARAPLEMLRGRFRWQLLVKGRRRAEVRWLLPALAEVCDRVRRQRLRAAVDVDPVSML